MMNLLLAIIYSKFKEKIEIGLDNEKDDRLIFLKEKFKEYSKDNNNWLDKEGMYKYFITIHSVVNNKH